MTPFSMEMTAAHRKFEFERAVRTAQTEGNIRRAAKESKQRLERPEHPGPPDGRVQPRSLFAVLRRLVPTRLSRASAQSATSRS